MKRSRWIQLCLTHIVSLTIFFCLMLFTPNGRHPIQAAPSFRPQPQAAGSITGHVYEADGVTPIVNLRVYTEEYDGGDEQAEIETGLDGSYALTNLPSGSYRVAVCPSCTGQAYVREYYRETDQHHLATRVTVTAPGTTSGIDFTLDRAGIVTGRVTDSGGAPIPDLHIGAIRDADGAWFGGPSTDASGYYTFTEVPPTDVYIYACSRCNNQPYIDEYYDDSRTEGGATVLSISAGVTTTNVNFGLDRGGAISGYVYEADGVTPLANAYVDAEEFYAGQWGHGTGTGTDGSYTIRGLPTGGYRVRAEAPGYIGEYYRDTVDRGGADRVTVTAPNTTAGIDFTLARGDATIRGHVRYGDGTPVSGIMVEASRWGGPGGDYTHTDASGAYALSVSAGNWIVEINRWDGRADGYTMEAMRVVPIGSGETQDDVDIVLLPNNATVAGTVRTQGGTPIRGAEVALRDQVTGWYLGREVNADVSGTYALLVPAGTWRINAWREGYIQPPDQQITVGTGQTLHQDLYLTELNSSIAGRVLDQYDEPVPGAWVWGEHPKHEGGTGVHAGANGDYVLPVYAGVWDVHAGHPPRYTSLSERAIMVREGEHLSGIDLRLNRATAVVQGTVRLGSYAGPPIDRQAETRVDNQERSEWINYHTLGSTGFYTSGVTAGSWYAYVNLEGYTCQESREFDINDGETVQVDLVLLTNTAIIQGDITDQYGFPVPSADVGILDPVSGREMIPWDLGWADSTGQYAVGVAAGRWCVCAWRDGYDDPPCPEIAMADGETRPLNFVLQSRISAIDGLVTDLRPDPADNVPLEGAAIQLWDAHGIAPVSGGDGPVVGDTTGADGRFGFSLEVSNGPYLVRAFKEGYGYGQGLIYALGGRHPAGTLRLPLEVGGTISGRVTDGSAPIAGAVVIVRQAGSQSGAFAQDGSLARTRTDANGDYAFSVPFAPGDYTVVVSAIGYAQAATAVTVVPRADTVADMTLTRAAVPAYGVAYLTANMTTTMQENRQYPALLQVRNTGRETWIGSGDDAAQFYYEWRDDQGNIRADGELAELPYDIEPGDTVFVSASLRAPEEGDYTLEWGLWQGGNWVGDTQSFHVTVTAPDLPNLAIRDTDMPTDPPTVREGGAFNLLVLVRNDSEVDASDVGVHISVDGHPFGAGHYTLASVPRRSTILLRTAAYKPLRQGFHVISVQVDPDNHINERNESDNSASQVIRVFPSSADAIAPSGAITVNYGALTTNSPSVDLTLFAEDNPGGTGVQQMYVTEFVFDAAAGQWQIVQESDWIRYTTHLPWTLSPGGGAKHFQARFVDGAWNISEAALAWINYTPTCDSIALAEWKLYQWQLSAGEAMTTRLTACGGQGDVDLYAWIGASAGSPHYYSSNAGVAPDTIALVAPETDEYNFWVYGFEETTYDLTMARGIDGLDAIARDREPQAQSGGKGLPQVPPSTIESPIYVPATPVYRYWFPWFPWFAPFPTNWQQSP